MFKLRQSSYSFLLQADRWSSISLCLWRYPAQARGIFYCFENINYKELSNFKRIFFNLSPPLYPPNPFEPTTLWQGIIIGSLFFFKA